MQEVWQPGEAYTRRIPTASNYCHECSRLHAKCFGSTILVSCLSALFFWPQHVLRAARWREKAEPQSEGLVSDGDVAVDPTRLLVHEHRTIIEAHLRNRMGKRRSDVGDLGRWAGELRHLPGHLTGQIIGQFTGQLTGQLVGQFVQRTFPLATSHGP